MPGEDAGDPEPIDWPSMYLIARGWGLSPTDFWNMTFAEFTLEFEIRRPRDAQTDLPGSLTRTDINDLQAWNPE